MLTKVTIFKSYQVKIIVCYSEIQNVLFLSYFIMVLYVRVLSRYMCENLVEKVSNKEIVLKNRYISDWSDQLITMCSY